ncbi:MAG: hypothetical protein AB8C02_09980 [Halioglobus sp.]
MTATVFLLLSVLVVVYLLHMRKRSLYAQDHQPALGFRQSFHVCILFKVHSGQKTLESARGFTHQILSGGDIRLIYAGQVAFSIDSDQLGPARWDGILMFELPSRERFNAAYSERFRRSRNLFSASYLSGMQRSRARSFAVPYIQLRRLLADFFWNRTAHSPLVHLPELKALPRYDNVRGYARRLAAAYEINSEALVVYNLGKRPPLASGKDYTDDVKPLMVRLAALGLGALHIGRFARIEHNAVFDSVHVVQYPDAKSFSELLQSQFYSTIAESPAFADRLLVASVPVTHRL